MRTLICVAVLAVPAVAGAQNYYPYSPPPAPYVNPYVLPQPAAPARPKTTYDWQTGSTYRTTPTPNGGARINGYNPYTGSTWNTTVKPNGQQSGTDADGNSWTYNPQTGFYMNYGTGKMCTGTGAARVCN